MSSLKIVLHLFRIRIHILLHTNENRYNLHNLQLICCVHVCVYMHICFSLHYTIQSFHGSGRILVHFYIISILSHGFTLSVLCYIFYNITYINKEGDNQVLLFRKYVLNYVTKFTWCICSHENFSMVSENYKHVKIWESVSFAGMLSLSIHGACSRAAGSSNKNSLVSSRAQQDMYCMVQNVHICPSKTCKMGVGVNAGDDNA